MHDSPCWTYSDYKQENFVWPWFPKCFDYIRENVVILWWLGLFLLSFHVSRHHPLAVILRSTWWTLAGCGHRPAAPHQWLSSHSCVSQTTCCQWNPAVRHWFLPLSLWMLPPCCPFYFLRLEFRICFQPKLRNLPARVILPFLGKLQGGKKISCTTSKHINWRSRPLHWTILKARLLSQTAQHSTVQWHFIRAAWHCSVVLMSSSCFVLFFCRKWFIVGHSGEKLLSSKWWHIFYKLFASPAILLSGRRLFSGLCAAKISRERRCGRVEYSTNSDKCDAPKWTVTMNKVILM